MPCQAGTEFCPACGRPAVCRERVLTADQPPLEALTCALCGEWWFETPD